MAVAVAAVARAVAAGAVAPMAVAGVEVEAVARARPGMARELAGDTAGDGSIYGRPLGTAPAPTAPASWLGLLRSQAAIPVPSSLVCSREGRGDGERSSGSGHAAAVAAEGELYLG